MPRPILLRRRRFTIWHGSKGCGLLLRRVALFRHTRMSFERRERWKSGPDRARIAIAEFLLMGRTFQAPRETFRSSAHTHQTLRRDNPKRVKPRLTGGLLLPTT